MATIKSRIAALEIERQNRPQKISPELEADIRVAIDWWEANGRRYDLLPRNDMSEGQRAALPEVLRFMAKFEEEY